jgi:hypothetical protein
MLGTKGNEANGGRGDKPGVEFIELRLIAQFKFPASHFFGSFVCFGSSLTSSKAEHSTQAGTGHYYWWSAHTWRT